MTQEHPITPPPELVQEWAKQMITPDDGNLALDFDWFATQAARWGADQELEACDKSLRKIWQMDHVSTVDDFLRELRAARRPKPPSLAEQALQEINVAECYMDSANVGYDFTAVRRALERLQELEGNG